MCLKPKIITCEVPQGLVMGLLLFIIFANNLICNANNGSLVLFVDDTWYLVFENDFGNLKNTAQS